MASLAHGLRLPGLVVLACAGVVVACFLAAVVDFTRTENRVPPVPPLCEPSTSACEEARNAKFLPRLEAARRLETEYRRRAWLYSLVAVAAIGVATVSTLRRRESAAGRRRVFTNLGTVGVALGVAAVMVTLRTEGGLVQVPGGPAFLPALAAISAAAAGGLVTRLQSPEPAPLRADEAGPVWYRLARILALGGLALTAATVFLASAYANAQPGCGGGENVSAPAWTDAVATVALFTTGGAVVLGVLALLLRRWVVALVSLFVSPTSLLFMAASSCAFY
jgi:hypothetical protein